MNKFEKQLDELLTSFINSFKDWVEDFEDFEDFGTKKSIIINTKLIEKEEED